MVDGGSTAVALSVPVGMMLWGGAFDAGVVVGGCVCTGGSDGVKVGVSDGGCVGGSVLVLLFCTGGG